MTSSLDIIRGRQVVQTLTNQSGGGVIAGDVIIIDTAHDESFTTTTTAAYNASQVGIALDTIAAAGTGRILLQGYAPLVNVSASATRGYYLFSHTVAKQATSSATFAAGAFGQVLKAGTSPSAYVFPPSLVTAGLADGTWTDYTATSTVVGWGSFTIKKIYYKQVGKTISVMYEFTGASNSATITFTLPFAAVATPANILWTDIVRDNGGAYVAGVAALSGGASTVTLYATANFSGFTASGTKEAFGQFWYVTT